MNYYHASKDNQPVGPYTLQQMRQLHDQGKLDDDSWVIVEGATKWTSYASLFSSISEEGQKSSPMNRCPVCGARNEDQARFCAECGSKLADTPLAEPSRPQGANMTRPRSGNPASLPASDSPYRGRGGWLSFFCAVQIVLVPIVQVLFFLLIFNTANDAAERGYPRARFIMQSESIANLVITGFGILASIMLLLLRPGAVRIVKLYLFTALAFSFLGLFLPQMYGLPSKTTESWMQEPRIGPVAAFVRTLIGFVIWFTYFNVSRRVRATFPKG